MFFFFSSSQIVAACFFILLTALSCIYFISPFFLPSWTALWWAVFSCLHFSTKGVLLPMFLWDISCIFNVETPFAAPAHVLCVLRLDTFLFAFYLKAAVLCMIHPFVCPFKCSRHSQGAEEKCSTLLPVCNYNVLGKKRDQVQRHYVRPCWQFKRSSLDVLLSVIRSSQHALAKSH